MNDFYATYLVDAHRPAMGCANKYGLPQTVFYHPDHQHTCTNTGASILRDKKTVMFVTWLPDNFYDREST